MKNMNFLSLVKSRYFTLIFALALFMGVTSCSSDPFENDAVLAEEQPLSDAELVEQQLSKLHRTRAGNDSLIMVLVTTKSEVNFTMIIDTDLYVDWGDGESDTITYFDAMFSFTHQYTDTDPAHTILIHGSNSTVNQLMVPNNGLIYMDITQNDRLDGLYCENNRLTYLDLSGNRYIRYVNCYENRISFLDISDNASILNICVANNRLTSLVLFKNDFLKEIDVSNNNGSAMDLSEAIYLESLTVTNNGLSSLDLSANPRLKRLNCSHNQLTSLNLNAKPALYYLDCSYNPLLGSLDISTNSLMESLYCQQNLTLSQITCPLSPIANLKNIDITDTPLADTPSNMALYDFLQAIPNRSTSTTPGTFVIGGSPNYGRVEYYLLGMNWVVE